jgi:hypothetical protein
MSSVTCCARSHGSPSPVTFGATSRERELVLVPGANPAPEPRPRTRERGNPPGRSGLSLTTMGRHEMPNLTLSDRSRRSRAPRTSVTRDGLAERDTIQV